MVSLNKKPASGLALLQSGSGERESGEGCSELPQCGVHQDTGVTNEIYHKITSESFPTMSLDPCGQAGAVSPSPVQI